jgi:hypothetical protein
MQYIFFVAVSAIICGVLSRWYMLQAEKSWKSGALFGVIGSIVAITAAFVTGAAAVFKLLSRGHRRLTEFLAFLLELDHAGFAWLLGAPC